MGEKNDKEWHYNSNLGHAKLFCNNSNGTFTDVSSTAGIDAPVIGSGCMCCDIDNNGWLDIVQFTYSRSQDAIYTLRTGRGPGGGIPMRVWHNNRGGTLTNIAPQLGLNGCWGTMSGTVGDVNDDGHLDILLGNGDPAMDRTEASMLLENDGCHFHNVTFAACRRVTVRNIGWFQGGLASGTFRTNSTLALVPLRRLSGWRFSGRAATCNGLNSSL